MIVLHIFWDPNNSSFFLKCPMSHSLHSCWSTSKWLASKKSRQNEELSFTYSYGRQVAALNDGYLCVQFGQFLGRQLWSLFHLFCHSMNTMQDGFMHREWQSCHLACQYGFSISINESPKSSIGTWPVKAGKTVRSYHVEAFLIDNIWSESAFSFSFGSRIPTVASQFFSILTVKREVWLLMASWLNILIEFLMHITKQIARQPNWLLLVKKSRTRI